MVLLGVPREKKIRGTSTGNIDTMGNKRPSEKF